MGEVRLDKRADGLSGFINDKSSLYLCQYMHGLYSTRLCTQLSLSLVTDKADVNNVAKQLRYISRWYGQQRRKRITSDGLALSSCARHIIKDLRRVAVQYRDLDMECDCCSGDPGCYFSENNDHDFVRPTSPFSLTNQKDASYLLVHGFSEEHLKTYHKRSCMNVRFAFSSVVTRGHLLRKRQISKCSPQVLLSESLFKRYEAVRTVRKMNVCKKEIGH
jgi:hypothetical protein